MPIGVEVLERDVSTEDVDAFVVRITALTNTGWKAVGYLSNTEGKLVSVIFNRIMDTATQAKYISDKNVSKVQ